MSDGDGDRARGTAGVGRVGNGARKAENSVGECGELRGAAALLGRMR